MPPNGKKNWFKIITGVLTFFLVGTYATVFDGIEQVKGILEGPQVNREQDSLIKELQQENLYLHAVNEMFFHTFRAMTDNDDKYHYVIEFGGGRYTHDVDIRNTAEKELLAFIYDMWIIYPPSFDYADSTIMTVKLHDYKEIEGKDIKLKRIE